MHSGTTVFWKAWKGDPRFLCFDRPFRCAEEMNGTDPDNNAKGTLDELIELGRKEPPTFWRRAAAISPLEELDEAFTEAQPPSSAISSTRPVDRHRRDPSSPPPSFAVCPRSRGARRAPPPTSARLRPLSPLPSDGTREPPPHGDPMVAPRRQPKDVLETRRSLLDKTDAETPHPYGPQHRNGGQDGRRSRKSLRTSGRLAETNVPAPAGRATGRGPCVRHGAVFCTDRKHEERIVAVTFDDRASRSSDHRLFTCFFVASQTRLRTIRQRASRTPAAHGQNEVRRRHRAGMEVGSHTLTHPNLAHLDPPQALREIADSRRGLPELIGSDVGSWAYPYGRYDPPVRDFVKESGCTAAVTVEPRRAYRSDDPYALPRLGVVLERPVGWPLLVARTPLLDRKTRADPAPHASRKT